jgi:hypothetical protein
MQLSRKQYVVCHTTIVPRRIVFLSDAVFVVRYDVDYARRVCTGRDIQTMAFSCTAQAMFFQYQFVTTLSVGTTVPGPSPVHYLLTPLDVNTSVPRSPCDASDKHFKKQLF